MNDPADRGGATKYGITQAVARANGYSLCDIYKCEYAEKPGFTAFPSKVAAVCNSDITSLSLKYGKASLVDGLTEQTKNIITVTSVILNGL